MPVGTAVRHVRVCAIPFLTAFVFLLVLFGQNTSFASSETAELEAASLEQTDSKNTVFIIDVSTSMFDIVDDLKEALKDYIGESKVGDSIAVVSFGAGAQLHYRKTINGPGDLEKILHFCDTLGCTDEFTYIPCGLNKGFEELYRLYQEKPASESLLVLMSDGINHPPDNIDKESVLTYDFIEKEFLPEFSPGKDWFITYVALKGQLDPELADFVNKCRGSVIEVGGKLLGGISEVQLQSSCPVDDGSLLDMGVACLPMRRRIPILIKPIRGRPAGKRIQVEGVIPDDPLGTRLDLTVKPAEIICPKKPQQIELELSVNGEWTEALQGTINFSPPDGMLLLIHPSHLLFRARKPPKILVGKYDKEVKDYEWNKEVYLTLGPLKKAGDSKQDTFALKLEGQLPPGKINIDAVPQIALPAGIDCLVDVDVAELIKNGMTTVSVTATAAKDLALMGNEEWDGNVSLRTSSEVLLPENPLHLRVHSKVTHVNVKWTGLIWRIMLALLLSFVVVGLIAFAAKTQQKRFVPAEGTLLILDSPKGLQLENINLKKISERVRKKRLLIGNGSSADINLLHKSVEKRHAVIRVTRKLRTTSLFIKSLGLADVAVNNKNIQEETKLSDRDIIRIGEFQFLFSNSQLKQVVVHYSDGDVKYGIPLSWNIEEKGFLLQSEKDGSAPMFVLFKDLKAVFFVKHFDKEIARKMKISSIFAQKDHLIVHFRDKENLEGYTIKEYSPEAPRFFLVPRSVADREENNICVLVERSFTDKITVLKEANKSEEVDTAEEES